MKFYPGQEFYHDGIVYRVRAGRVEGDLILDFMVDFQVGGWHTPAIAHALILAAFKFQVEENKYGKKGVIRRGGRGGWMLVDAIKEACRYGWEGVAARIALERRQAEGRRNAA